MTKPSLLPSLSALLLLVPLVAATICVLLWRQKHISDRGESSGVFLLFLTALPVLPISGPSRLPMRDMNLYILWGGCNESAPASSLPVHLSVVLHVSE